MMYAACNAYFNLTRSSFVSLLSGLVSVFLLPTHLGLVPDVLLSAVLIFIYLVLMVSS